MWLAVLQLRHGRRNGVAAPELPARYPSGKVVLIYRVSTPTTMETLTKHFESQVTGFLECPGLKPSMFGLRATGDPNLMRQPRRGRSPTLATADRILAFIDAYDRAQADRISSRSRPIGGSSLRGRRARAVTGAIDQEMEVPVRARTVAEHDLHASG